MHVLQIGVVSWKLIFPLTFTTSELKLSFEAFDRVFIWYSMDSNNRILLWLENQEFFNGLSLLIKLSGLWQRAINIHTSHVSTFVAFEDP